MAGYAILWDLDQCIADWSHRLPLREAGNWTDFYAEIPNDPTLPGAVLWNLLANQARMLEQAVIQKALNIDYPVLDVLTCRPERMREATVKWFEDNGLLQPRVMHMRRDDDIRPPQEIKVEMWRKHYEGVEEVLALFEDNADTIEAFREIGITCYHVR